MEHSKLLESILEKVRDDVDKREGSIIYDAVAPISYYLSEQRQLIEELKNEAFIDTASGGFLDRLAIGYGITRKEAKKAIRLATSNKELKIGSILSIQDVDYKVIKKDEHSLIYELECTQYGNIGNLYTGEMTSENTDAKVYLSSIVEVGTKEESDDELRDRILLKIRQPSTSGNIYHYMNWALEVNGVKEARVFPLESGNGTVGVMIYADTDDSTLIDKVAKHIEERRPIGASITVYMPKAIELDINAYISINAGANQADIAKKIEEEIKKYLEKSVFIKEYISYAKINSIVLSADGVEDVISLSINGGSENIKLDERNIARLSKLVLAVR